MRKPGDTDGPGPLSPLEQAVLAALTRGSPALAAQARAASCQSRTWSGVGFLTRLAVPAELSAAGADVRVAPLRATHGALTEPAEFLLQLRAGRLASLEAFCGDGYWPDDEAGFQLVGQDAVPLGAAPALR